jgi:hypothetical protein
LPAPIFSRCLLQLGSAEAMLGRVAMAASRVPQIVLGFFAALLVLVVAAPLIGVDSAALVAGVALLAFYGAVEVLVRTRSSAANPSSGHSGRKGGPVTEDRLPSYLLEEPIRTPDQDLYGRTSFARQIASYIVRAKLDTAGRVLALTAPWGTGKTSVLNLIAGELAESSEWSVVRFNPWAVTGLEALLRDFFQTLNTAFSDRANYEALRRALAKYADAVSPWAGVVKVPLVDPQKAVDAIRQLLYRGQTVDDLHTVVGKLIDASAKRTLILIDDVDRLQSDELLLVFKLVRLVGSLPKLDYLLAFDEESVVKAIQRSSLDEEQARAYLDKVVPTRFHVPAPHSKYVDAVFNAYFSSWLTASAVSVFPDDTTRLSAAYYAWMLPRLSIPRSLKALFAEAGPPMMLLGAEANPVDVLLLAYLRHFAPSIFVHLPAWKAELTSSAAVGIAAAVGIGPQMTRDQRREQWRRRFEAVGLAQRDEEAALTFLAQLFLPLRGVLEGWGVSTNELWEELDRRRRVGSPYYFDRYFGQGLAPDELSDVAIDDALAKIRSGDSSGLTSLNTLLNVDSDRVLSRLYLMRSETRIEDQLRILVGLALARDQLPDATTFALSPRRRAEHWAAQVLRQASKEEIPLADILQPLVASQSGFHMLLSAIDIALAEIGRTNEPVPKDLELVRDLVVGGVSRELQSLRKLPIQNVPHDDLLWFLYSWGRIDSTIKMREWVADRLREGEWDIVDLAAFCVPIGTSFGTASAPRPVLSDFLMNEFDDLVEWGFARTLLKGIVEQPDIAVDRYDVSFKNRRDIASTALRRRLAEDQALRNPGPQLIRELLSANSRAYMTIGVEAVPYDPRQLSDETLDVAEDLARRLNPSATAQTATSTAAWWQTGEAGAPEWILWVYPGPTVVLKTQAPISTTTDGASAFAIADIVHWWKSLVTELSETMRSLRKNEVRFGVSLQTQPMGSTGIGTQPIVRLDFGAIKDPGRRAQPHQIQPWSHMFEPVSVGQVPGDFESALRELVKQFQYRDVDRTAKSLSDLP